MKLRQRLGAFGLVGLAMMVAACGPTPSAGPGACVPADGNAVQILNLANQARASAGVGPLAWDGQLACLAQGWSGQMAATGGFGHSNLGATLRAPAFRRFRTLGENILRAGEGTSADAMHEAWMNSPSHQANILSPGFRFLGVGIVYANGQVVATQNFGA